jgi:hypothetical protein
MFQRFTELNLSSSLPIVCPRASTVRSAASRSKSLSFENASSIGFKSGLEDGGRWTARRDGLAHADHLRSPGRKPRTANATCPTCAGITGQLVESVAVYLNMHIFVYPEIHISK